MPKFTADTARSSILSGDLALVREVFADADYQPWF